MRNIFVLSIALCLFTAVYSKSPRPMFSFVQLTDPQMGFISSNKNCMEECRLYTQTVNYINKIKPSFVVITGDLVHNRMDTNQLNSFQRITSTIRKNIPVHILPGNHDVGMEPTTASIDSFLQRYTTDKFGFTHKNVQFIGLNSQLINSGLEREKTQFDWLKACMTKHPSMRKVVFTHQPFYTKNPEEKDTYDNIAQPKRMEYLQLLKANGVVSVFSGHFHKNAENQYPGMDLVISSAVGKALGTEGSGLRIVQVYKDSIAHHFIELSKLTE